MLQFHFSLVACFLLGVLRPTVAVIYTYEDVELRRIFPVEFPQDTVRRSGSVDPELVETGYAFLYGDFEWQHTHFALFKHLGRYAELKSYFRYPKTQVNSHFEEFACYEEGSNKICKLNRDRYSAEEESYYNSPVTESYMDRRRVYCIMLLCFTEDELDRVVASF